MVGRNLNGDYYRQDSETSHEEEVILSVEGLYTDSGLKDVSFQVHKGEILALCGLSDSGIHEVGKAVYGLTKARHGTVRLNIDDVKINNQSQAWHHRVGYVPKDRDNEALMLNASICENFSMSSIPDLTRRFGFLRESDLTTLSNDAREQFQVKCTGVEQEITH
jgi:ribose transport system ATP-binding protein